jgi:hypothetical protein
MTETWESAYESLINAIEEISDPVAQYQAIKELEGRLDPELKRFKADIANLLHQEHSWAGVGRLIGVTGSRAEQLSRAAR